MFPLPEPAGAQVHWRMIHSKMILIRIYLKNMIRDHQKKLSSMLLLSLSY